MKTLLLLRHAKSSHGDVTLDDHDRPLNRRGEQDAEKMGRVIAQRFGTPDLVLCSTALRTRETWARVAPSLAASPDVCFEHAIYLASPETLLKRLRDVPASVTRIMMIGHNPGMEALAILLVRDPESAAERKLQEKASSKFPTAALAVLEIPIETWNALKPDTATLAAFIQPKDL